MKRADLFAGLAELMANPFIPELHKDDCEDPSCVRCEPESASRVESLSDRTMRELRETPGTHPAPCWAPHTGCTCAEGGAR